MSRRVGRGSGLGMHNLDAGNNMIRFGTSNAMSLSSHPGAWTTSNLGSADPYQDGGFPQTPNLNVSRLTGLQKVEVAKKMKSQTNSPNRIKQLQNAQGEVIHRNSDLTNENNEGLMDFMDTQQYPFHSGPKFSSGHQRHFMKTVTQGFKRANTSHKTPPVGFYFHN